MTRPVALKAIVGALLALSTWGGTALLDGLVDPVEWFGLLGALVTGGLVYAVRNGAEIDGTTSTPQYDEHGAIRLEPLIVLVAIVLLFILAATVL